MDYKSEIKTVADAFRYLNIPDTLPDVSALPDAGLAKYLIAEYKTAIVVKALNQEANNGKPWEPDWNNTSQYKYYPFYWVDASVEKPAGFGFSHAHCDDTDSDTTVGSRLCYVSRHVALYAAEQFKELYQEKLLIS